MFEFAQLRSFIAVAEELHFGRAAARLHMSQPPLSRQIILLEHQVGVRLFVRNNRRVELTLAGRAFLPEARRLLKLAESAIRSARRVACGEVGQVTISFTASAGYDFLPPILRRLREELPGVECILKEMVSIDQLDALEAREVDIALLRPPVRRAGLEDERVSRETLIVAIPSTHRLSEMVTVSLAEVAEEKMVTYSAPEGRYFNELMNRLFAPAGITPDSIEAVSQVHTALALVRAGLGIAFVPEAARKLHFEDVKFLELDPAPRFFVDLHSAWRRDNDNPALPKALDVIAAAHRHAR